MTQLLSQDALLSCSVSKMKKYCLENTVSFKILLFVSSAPGRPFFIGDLHSDIKVMFLHPNTTSLIHQMDLSVTVAFKAHSQRRTFAHVIAATEEDTDAVLEALPHL